MEIITEVVHAQVPEVEQNSKIDPGCATLDMHFLIGEGCRALS